MNAKHYLLLLWAVMASLSSCEETNRTPTSNKPQTPETTPGTVRQKGTPEGVLTQKTIGPEGGTLASADGRITLIVPQGAVTTATPFSVQPITNTLPGSPGLAYRLAPEGQTFAKSLTLRFQYAEKDLENTAAQALFMAYQGNDGIWKFLPHTQLDQQAKTLTVNTTHFSDWAPFAEFWLSPSKTILKPGETCEFVLLSPFDRLILGLEPTKEETELAITDVEPLSNPNNIKNWKVSAGTISPAQNKIRAKYKAPSTVPPQGILAEASVEVYNFIPPFYAERGVAGGKAIVLSHVRVEGLTYFRATVDGSPENCMNHGFILDKKGNMFSITGRFGESLDGINFHFKAPSTNPVGTFPFYSGDSREKEIGKGVGSLIYDGKSVGLSYYQVDCDGYVASPGSITIEKYETLDGISYIKGHFTMTVYKPNGCEGYSKKYQVNGEFYVSKIAYEGAGK